MTTIKAWRTLDLIHAFCDLISSTYTTRDLRRTEASLPLHAIVLPEGWHLGAIIRDSQTARSVLVVCLGTVIGTKCGNKSVSRRVGRATSSDIGK